MRVFKTFFKILKYYFGMIGLYLGIFIIMTIIFTNINTHDAVFEFTNERTNLAVVDEDSSALSESIVSLLEEKHNVVDIGEDSHSQTDALYNRKVEYIVTIPSGFESSFINESEIPKLQTQSVPNTYSSMYVTRLLDSFLNTAKAYLSTGTDINKAIKNATTDMSVSATVEYKDDNEGAREPIFFFFSFLPYAIIMTTIIGIGIELLAFNKKDIAMRTNSSSLSLSRKNGELGLGMCVMAVGLMIIFVIFGLIMYGSNMFTSGSLVCLLNMVVFTIFSVALAFLIGTLAKNINVVNGAANALGLAMCFIGGVFVPREVMSDSVLSIARFVPTYWYTNAVETVAFGDGLSAGMTSSIGVDMLIQLLFAAALITVAMVISKQKRKIA